MAAAVLARAQAPAPAGQAPPPGEARAIMDRTLALYSKAKSYQGAWTYALKRGAETQTAQVDIKARGADHLLFRLLGAPARDAKRSGEAIPEMLIAIDGVSAVCANISEKVYFRVTLPRGWKGSPLMFFPQMASVGDVRKGADGTLEGRRTSVLEADRPDGGKTRLEIDAETGRMRRITVEMGAGAIAVVSTITVTRETLDAELADSAFAYRPPKGTREMPPPPDAMGLFGIGAPADPAGGAPPTDRATDRKTGPTH